MNTKPNNLPATPVKALRYQKRRSRKLSTDYERMGLCKKINGIWGLELAERSWTDLFSKMEAYGNVLSKNHKDALKALAVWITFMAQGRVHGRYAFALPTGCGKTLTIRSWIAALHQLNRDHIGVAVVESKIEELCTLKRQLIEDGVPAEKIGLIHSYEHKPKKIAESGVHRRVSDGFATEPSDHDKGGYERQILLITHAKLRSNKASVEKFNSYQGKPREVMLYDESLITSDSIGIPFRKISSGVSWLADEMQGLAKYTAVLEYLTRCRDQIGRTFDAQKDAANSTEAIINLPLPPGGMDTLEVYRRLIPRESVMKHALRMLDLVGRDIRVIPTCQGGIIHYQVAVPSELENILVLDASYPIRRLMHLDKTIAGVESSPDAIHRVDGGLSNIKEFDRVTIRQLAKGGGRSTLEKDFGAPQEDERHVLREIVHVVKEEVPEDEAVLIFTYKYRGGVDCAKELRAALERAGVDTEAKVFGPGLSKDGQLRIVIDTWGRETGYNGYSYIKNVILAGVMQRSPVDITAAAHGQADSRLKGDYDGSYIQQLIRSEVCHLIYQALSRGSCRVIDNGHAMPMQAWLIHKDTTIQRELSKVMPGVQWKAWEPRYLDTSPGIIHTTAQQVTKHLNGLDRSCEKISTRGLKVALGLNDRIPKNTFGEAVKLAVDELLPPNTWHRHNRSVVRHGLYQTLTAETPSTN